MKVKRILGILFSLALFMAMMPALGMTQTVYADSTKAYADYDVTTDANKDKAGDDLAALKVTFNGYEWYIIKDGSSSMDAGKVTLLAADDYFGKSAFNSGDRHNADYRDSDVKKYLDKVVAGTAGEGKPDFSSVADTMISMDNCKLYPPSIGEARNVPVNVRKFTDRWWLRSAGVAPSQAHMVVAMYVQGDGVLSEDAPLVQHTTGAPVINSNLVRPALQLDLSKVAFDPDTKEFSLKPYSYMAWNGAKVEKAADPCTEYREVTAGTTTLEDGKWYVVNDIIENANRIAVNGTAHLILKDGAKLTATKGITVNSGNALYIYPGNTGDTIKGTGELIADAGSMDEYTTGIGGEGERGHGGTVIINGGKVTANGAENGVGIGGAHLCNGGTVAIYGGIVRANGGNGNGGYGAKGIGAGVNEGSVVTDGTLTIGPGVKLETSTDKQNWTDTTLTPAIRPQYMRALYSSHKHEFTYEATGATITATCLIDDCNLPSSTEDGSDHVATLTIDAPLHTTYEDGKEAAAQITDDNLIQGSSKVQYQEKTDGSTYGTASDTPPTDPGTYKASITLDETATASIEYTIEPASISSAAVTGIEDKEYTGEEITQDITVKLGDKTLTEDDYTVEYKDNTDNGIATVKIIGKGNYTGETEKTFEIYDYIENVQLYNICKDLDPINKVKFTTETDESQTGIDEQLWLGEDFEGINAVDPTVPAVGKTYSYLIYLNAKDGWRFRDETPVYVDGEQEPIAKLQIVEDDPEHGYIFFSSPDSGVMPCVTVDPVDIGGANVTGVADKDHTGSAITQDPTVKMNVGGTDYTLKNGTDYTLSYSNNVNVGTATMTITGKGKFSGAKSVTFKIDYSPGENPAQKGTDGTAVGPGASAACAEKAILGMKSDSDPKGSVYGKVKLRSTKQGKTYETIKWTKVSGAKKYVLYGNKCGKSNKMKKIGTYTGSSKKLTKVAGKKIKKGTYYKFIMVALDKNNNVISTSKVIHVATKGGKVTNPKTVAVKRGTKKISSVSVKAGKTVTVKNKVSKVSKKKALKKHRVVKYESSNKKIATVTSKGAIKGVKKGTAYVYAYAQNGVAKKVKVTVK